MINTTLQLKHQTMNDKSDINTTFQNPYNLNVKIVRLSQQQDQTLRSTQMREKDTVIFVMMIISV